MSDPSNSSLPEAPVRPGEVVAGKYFIERILGKGSMGVVVAADHLQLETKVAIKFMLPEALGNADAVRRFTREAKAAARIKNEHATQVMDVGTLPSGAPYIVMEYLEGNNLHAVLEQNGRLPLEVAVDYILQACEALHDAHAVGIIHRDFKPENLFLVRRPDGKTLVKILDFGISKMRDAAGSQLGAKTQEAFMGSPMYMSPEQMMSPGDVDARTDVWAVAATLYQLLTGDVPFPGNTIPEVCAKVMYGEPTSIRQSRPDLPAELEAILVKCFAKDREQRFSSIAALGAELDRFGSARARSPSHADGAGGPQHAQFGGSNADPGATVRAWGTNRTPPLASRPRARWIVAGTSAAIAVALVAFFSLRSPPAEEALNGSSRTAAATGSVATPEGTAASDPSGNDYPDPKRAPARPEEVVPQHLDGLHAPDAGAPLGESGKTLREPRPVDKAASVAHPPAPVVVKKPLPTKKSGPPPADDLFSTQKR